MKLYSFNGTYYPVTYLSCDRDGHTYYGFYDAANGGNKVIDVSGSSAPVISVSITADTTLYARWSETVNYSLMYESSFCLLPFSAV